MSEYPSVKRTRNEIAPEDVILDRMVKESETGDLGDRKLELPLSRKVLYALLGIFLTFLFLFAAKVFDLQVIAQKHWAALAKKNVMREIPLAPDRGVIYDSHLVQLAFNESSFDFMCDKRDLPSSRAQKEQILQEIAFLVHLDVQDIAQQFDSTPEAQVLLEQDLSHDDLIALKTKEKDLQGCQVHENAKRMYPNAEIFSQILGYTAKVSADDGVLGNGYSVADEIGKSGVEKSYENVLRGKPGTFVIEKDARGKTVKQWEESQPSAGKSLVLWLDAGLQKAITDAFQDVFSKIGAKQAAAVALDPNTGGILSLVSLPSFDSNMFAKNISQKEWQEFLVNPLRPLFNKAISGVGFPTGSVIKPFMASAALQEGVINEKTTLFAPSELCVPNKFTSSQDCFHDWTFHGWSDVKRAIAESVNPFFYIIGGGHDNFVGLGAERIKKYLELFGWGEKTGVDLPSEGAGILPTIDTNWRLGDTYHFSIGQGPFAVTPLQVATAFGAIANNGKLLEPKVVKKIVESLAAGPTIVRENFIDAKNLEIVQQGMRQTVTAGSATGWLNTLPIPVAAKTGTAQTGKKTPEGKDYLYSWTAAFAPVDHPKIVLVVVVGNVKEGQVASLPVVRDALQWYFK